MVQSKRSQQIEWYKQELEDANNTRNQVLENGLSAQLRGDKSSMKVHLLMLKNIDALIDRLYQNTIALIGSKKVYLQEQCYSDNTRTLYALKPEKCEWCGLHNATKEVGKFHLCDLCEIEAME